MPSKRKTIRRLIQIYAYLECLEILQGCPEFRKLGLDYDIEKRFPLPEK